MQNCSHHGFVVHETQHSLHRMFRFAMRVLLMGWKCGSFASWRGTFHVRKPLVQEENSICFSQQQRKILNLDGKHWKAKSQMSPRKLGQRNWGGPKFPKTDSLGSRVKFLKSVFWLDHTCFLIFRLVEPFRLKIPWSENVKAMAEYCWVCGRFNMAMSEHVPCLDHLSMSAECWRIFRLDVNLHQICQVWWFQSHFIEINLKYMKCLWCEANSRAQGILLQGLTVIWLVLIQWLKSPGFAWWNWWFQPFKQAKLDPVNSMFEGLQVGQQQVCFWEPAVFYTLLLDVEFKSNRVSW